MNAWGEAKIAVLVGCGALGEMEKMTQPHHLASGWPARGVVSGAVKVRIDDPQLENRRISPDASNPSNPST